MSFMTGKPLEEGRLAPKWDKFVFEKRKMCTRHGNREGTGCSKVR